MKYRIYAKRWGLYTDSPLWPSNQRHYSEFFFDGEVVKEKVYDIYHGIEPICINDVDQNDFMVDYIEEEKE